MTEISEILLYGILEVFGIGFTAYLIQAIATTDMLAWTFTGHEMVAGLLTVFPYIFLLAIICIPVYTIMRRKAD